MLSFLLIAAALAEEPSSTDAAASDWGLVLAGGLGGAVGPPAVQGHVVGRAILELGRFGLAFGGREGVATSDLRTVGGIFAGLHADLGRGFVARGGFAHHHETPWTEFQRSPFGSFAGVSEGIVHRSGFELGAAYLTDQGQFLEMLPWLGLGVDLSAVVLPDDLGPPVYLCSELLFTVRVK